MTSERPGIVRAEPPHAPSISVVMATFNRASSLAACLDSILRIDHPSFEVIVCDDHSSDDTPAVIAAYAARDPRVIALRTPRNGGPSTARNMGVRLARGELVFFTDDDVIVSPDWLAEGARPFERDRVVGMEGRIVFVSEDYRPRYGDRVQENPDGGQFMTANVAYRRASLLDGGLFDEGLRRFEDRELGLRMAQRGEIVFAADCLVYHRLERYTPRSFFAESLHVRLLIPVMRRTGDRNQLVGRVFLPSKLLAIVFPPLVLLRLRSRRLRGRTDYACLLLAYPRLVRERLILWRTAIAERFLVI